jgi:hypothetical protein
VLRIVQRATIGRGVEGLADIAAWNHGDMRMIASASLRIDGLCTRVGYVRWVGDTTGVIDSSPTGRRARRRLAMKTISALTAGLAALGAVATLTLVGPPVLAQSAAVKPDATRVAFDRADVNKDGVLDIDEVVGDAIYVFAVYDKNRDGFLVIEELPRHDPARFKRADRDGDGRLSLSEVAADKVWEFFEVDANRDGVLTFEEVTAYANRIRK